MSLTYCTYLFLCVTMSHLCTDGNKIPSAIPRNALHGIKKIDKATIDLNRNFTLYLRDYFSQRTVGIQLILISYMLQDLINNWKTISSSGKWWTHCYIFIHFVLKLSSVSLQ